jgi:hypothetical protein
MARIDQLLTSFRKHVALPLRSGLPLSQRSWFVVYAPDEERRLVPRLPEFEIATRDAGLNWQLISLEGSYTEWVDSLEDGEREICLETPAILESYAETGLLDLLRKKISDAVALVPHDQQELTVFAIAGLMELFDFVHVSQLIEHLGKGFPGVLLIFFPGEREGNTYRFLGARDGWDYLAVPILAES